MITHPASASELPAPASATQHAHATASQSATQNGPPPPSTPHEQATQITHGTESSQPVHQNLIPQPTRGRPFSRQKLQHRRGAVWKLYGNHDFRIIFKNSGHTFCNDSKSATSI